MQATIGLLAIAWRDKACTGISVASGEILGSANMYIACWLKLKHA